MPKIVGEIIVVLVCVAFIVLLYVHDRPVIAAPIINCKNGNVMPPLVRDFDGRLWRVDVCAVAQDDAGASQYKTEVK